MNVEYSEGIFTVLAMYPISSEFFFAVTSSTWPGRMGPTKAPPSLWPSAEASAVVEMCRTFSVGWMLEFTKGCSKNGGCHLVGGNMAGL